MYRILYSSSRMLTSLIWSVYRYIELYLELLWEFSSLTPYVYICNPPYSILSHPDKHTTLHSNIHKLCPYHLGYIVLIYPWRFIHHCIPGYRTYPVPGIILYWDTGLILFQASLYTRIHDSSCSRHHSIPGYRTRSVPVIILYQDTWLILFQASLYTRIQDSSYFRNHSIPGYRTHSVPGIIISRIQDSSCSRHHSFNDTGLILFQASFYTRIRDSSCLRHHSIPGYRIIFH